jgi:hypothetical protein
MIVVYGLTSRGVIKERWVVNVRGPIGLQITNGAANVVAAAIELVRKYIADFPEDYSHIADFTASPLEVEKKTDFADICSLA